jgi:hypothetical protein
LSSDSIPGWWQACSQKLAVHRLAQNDGEYLAFPEPLTGFFYLLEASEIFSAGGGPVEWLRQNRFDQQRLRITAVLFGLPSLPSVASFASTAIFSSQATFFPQQDLTTLGHFSGFMGSWAH